MGKFFHPQLLLETSYLSDFLLCGSPGLDMLAEGYYTLFLVPHVVRATGSPVYQLLCAEALTRCVISLFYAS